MPSLILNSIFLNAKNSPQKIALVENENVLTYKDFLSEIISRASDFAALGVRKNHKLILIAEMNIDFILNYFACHFLSAVAAPIDKNSNDQSVESYKKILSTNYVFKGKPEIFNSNKNKAKHLSMDIHISNIADILFTTGTTSEPKGVILSQGNISAAAIHINAFLKNTSFDNELLCMPFSHSFGLTRLRCAMMAGSTCVLIDGLSRPKSFFKKIDDHNITGFGIVPAGWAFLRKIAKDKIKNYKDQIKYIELGSSPMMIDDKLDITSCLPKTHICMHYGSTEASRSCFLDFNKDVKFLNSVGSPSDGVDIAILDEEGNVLKHNQEGQVAISGNMVSSSYINYKKDTYKNNSNFHRMGDIGYLNKEGFLFLAGRSSDIINVGGKKVAPQEVEELLKVISGIKDCVCIGVPDKISGESLRAILVVDEKHEINYPSIKKFLHSKLESHKIPSSFDIVDKIPYTNSGKIKRKDLKMKYVKS